MKLRSNVCNRRRLVCVKFYLNRSRFAVVVAKCQGAHFFGTQCSSITWSMGHLGHLSRPGHRVIILTRCKTRVFPVFEKSPR